MSGIIGGAADFYRLRVIRYDESDEPDLEWRDDILYRTPPAQQVQEYDVWRVEAVDVDDDDRVVALASFQTDDEARSFLSAVEEDLAVMTRSEFERTYFPDQDAGGVSQAL